MARLGRWFVPGVPQHLIQRGNNRQAIFFADDDYRAYLGILGEAAADAGLAIHAFVLMTNHMHVLATPATPESIPRALQQVGRLYVRRVNRLYRRTGTLWEGRYRATVVDAEAYLFAVMRYIELNPVRAGLARSPYAYRWSSYRTNAVGDGPADIARMITPHPLYAALARTAPGRREAYKALFAEQLGAAALAEIRASVNGGWALGNDRFRDEIARMAERRAMPLARGRRPSARRDDV